MLKCFKSDPLSSDMRDYETDVLSSLIDVIPTYHLREIKIDKQT